MPRSGKEQAVNQGRPPTQTYVFGSSAAETERLQKLDQLLAACTRGFLREAGIDEGMKVLDHVSDAAAVMHHEG